MKRFPLVALFALGLSAWAVAHVDSDDQPKPHTEGGKQMLKGVIHVNFDDAERQKHGLKNVTNILKATNGAATANALR